MFYSRQLYTQLEVELQTREVTIITGMRRVGKTTALLHLFDLIKSENKTMLDLENPLHRKIFEEEDYDAVWNNLAQFGITKDKKAYLFLDEVQNLPQISRVAKYLYDHYDVKFFFTGSSSFYLRNLFPESLAGRKIIFEMFPLNFAEFLVFKEQKRESTDSFVLKAKSKNSVSYQKYIQYYREFMEFGGFPGVALEESQQRKRVLLSEIFTSYFEKDAKNLADFKEMSKLRDLILLLVPRIGSKLDIAKLSSELSLSRETVYSYLAFLEQTYFISLLPKFSSSIDRQAAGSKKLFFCDCGLVNMLGRISEGQLLEQSVFQNLRLFSSKLYFYSNKEGGEIDFIVDGKVALEVKMNISKHDIANLKKRGKSIKTQQNYIVSFKFTNYPQAVLVTDL